LVYPNEGAISIREVAMADRRPLTFDPKAFLSRLGEGRSIAIFRKGQVVFS
jgi:hypothetical protein